MRRLMLALSIASFIATPAVFAHGQHHAASHSGSHRAQARGHGSNRSYQSERDVALEDSDRSQALADSGRGRGRHHGNQPRMPDEEELAQPEQ